MLDAVQQDTVRVVVAQMSGAFGRKFGLDRDDVAQQAWVIALDALRTFDATRGRLDRFLLHAVRVRLVDYCVQQRCPVRLSNNGALRRGSEYQGASLDEWSACARDDGDPAERVDLRGAIRRATARMEPRARAALAREWGVGATFDGSAGSLRTARYRGREVLRAELATTT